MEKFHVVLLKIRISGGHTSGGLPMRPLEVKIDDTASHLSAGIQSSLTCRAYGARPAPLFTWFKDDEVVKQELGREGSSHNESFSEIFITPQLSDKRKIIKCSVLQRNETLRDSREQVSVEHKLETTRIMFVHYKPIVTLALGASLRVENMKEGDDIYFDCLVDAVPPPDKIEWFHNKNRLSHNLSQGRIISNHSLVLQKIDRNTSGEFTCSATNKEGEQTSSHISLDIKYAPVCRPGLPRVYGVGKHELVPISCEVEANPSDQLTFRWAFNGTTNGKVKLLPPANFTSTGATSILRYVPTTDVEFGTILCWAKSSVGLQEHPCAFHVVAAEKPDPVQNCTSTHPSTDALHLQCTEGFNGGLVQSFRLEVLSTDGTVLENNISSPRPSFSIRGLSPDTMFLLAVTAVNAKGRSEPVVTKVFTLRPPETQKNTEANSKTKLSGDFWTDNSPLIGAIIGAFFCLVLMTAPIVIACWRKARSVNRQTEIQPRLDTISGATNLRDVAVEKPDVVPARGSCQPPHYTMPAPPLAAIASSDIPLPPFCSSSLSRRQEGAAALSQDPWASHFSSTLPRKKAGHSFYNSEEKAYMNIHLLSERESSKHESQV